MGFKKAVILGALALSFLAAAYGTVRGVRWWQKETRSRELAAFASTLRHGYPPAAEVDAPGAEGQPTPRETVHRMVPDVAFTDLEGRTGSFREYRGSVLVVALTSIGCPISKKLVPALSRLPGAYPDGRVRFVLVNVDADADPGELKRHAGSFPGWRYVHDGDAGIARALRARTTTESFVIDAAQTLRYRGAVDDRYAIGVTRSDAGTAHLGHGLEAVLNGEPLPNPTTAAPGCVLGVASSEPAEPPATWFNQISRLMEYHCVECHRPGEAGPFSLQTYERAVAKQAMIQSVLKDRIMPPWFADPRYGRWRDTRAVSDLDRRLFAEWVAAGCALGDASDAPVPLKRSSGWTIREPDVVIDVEPQEIPAEGVIEWRKFPVSFVVTNDLWISEAEIRPSEPEVVHHAMLFVEYPEGDPRGRGQTRGESEESGGGSGFWLSYFPGRKAMILPEGRGKLIPRGGRVFIQLHYTPNGTAVIDKPRVGLRLLSAPPEKAVVSGAILKGDIRIAPNSRVTFLHKEVFDEDVRLLTLMPHMHTRGTRAAVFLKHPDGRQETLLSVTNFDFNWQVAYDFQKPLLVTRGTEMTIQHEFDNTASNPRNPDPAKALRYGYRTSDEMMVNFFDWEPAGDSPPQGKQEHRPFR